MCAQHKNMYISQKVIKALVFLSSLHSFFSCYCKVHKCKLNSQVPKPELRAAWVSLLMMTAAIHQAEKQTQCFPCTARISATLQGNTLVPSSGINQSLWGGREYSWYFTGPCDSLNVMKTKDPTPMPGECVNFSALTFSVKLLLICEGSGPQTYTATCILLTRQGQMSQSPEHFCLP